MKCPNCSHDMIQSKNGLLCLNCGHIEKPEILASATVDTSGGGSMRTAADKTPPKADDSAANPTDDAVKVSVGSDTTASTDDSKAEAETKPGSDTPSDEPIVTVNPAVDNSDTDDEKADDPAPVEDKTKPDEKPADDDSKTESDSDKAEADAEPRDVAGESLDQVIKELDVPKSDADDNKADDAKPDDKSDKAGDDEPKDATDTPEADAAKPDDKPADKPAEDLINSLPGGDKPIEITPATASEPAAGSDMPEGVKINLDAMKGLGDSSTDDQSDPAAADKPAEDDATDKTDNDKPADKDTAAEDPKPEAPKNDESKSDEVNEASDEPVVTKTDADKTDEVKTDEPSADEPAKTTPVDAGELHSDRKGKRIMPSFDAVTDDTADAPGVPKPTAPWESSSTAALTDAEKDELEPTPAEKHLEPLTLGSKGDDATPEADKPAEATEADTRSDAAGAPAPEDAEEPADPANVDLEPPAPTTPSAPAHTIEHNHNNAPFDAVSAPKPVASQAPAGPDQPEAGSKTPLTPTTRPKSLPVSMIVGIAAVVLIVVAVVAYLLVPHSIIPFVSQAEPVNNAPAANASTETAANPAPTATPSISPTPTTTPAADTAAHDAQRQADLAKYVAAYRATAKSGYYSVTPPAVTVSATDPSTTQPYQIVSAAPTALGQIRYQPGWQCGGPGVTPGKTASRYLALTLLLENGSGYCLDVK